MTRTRTPESQVLKQCLQLLRVRGLMVWRSNNVPVYDRAAGRYRGFRGLKGVADVLGCLPGGRLLAVECKAPGGRLTDDQRNFLDSVRALGGLAFVARDAAELDEALKAEGVY
jgi:hypothetical protein